VIIGDTAVGKTNILLRYVNEEYKMSHVTTIGVDFKIKTINIDGIKIKMQIWDTAGQERFKTITETYYKGAAGVVLVYSVTDRKSFNNLENWIKQINESQPESMCKVIVGNKVDCKETERQVSFQEGTSLANKYGVPFVECSAKDNYNISEIFNTIGKPIKERLVDGETTKGQNNIKIDSGDVKKKGDKKNCEC
jgi:Ras-related protein Rab-8A